MIHHPNPSHQQRQNLEESFGGNQLLYQSNQQCLFCSSKQLIMRQLDLLKEVVKEKNRKIHELEQFIHKLSHMMLSQQNDVKEDFTDTFEISKTKRIKNFISGSSFSSQHTNKSQSESMESKMDIDSNMIKQGQDRISIASSSKGSFLKSDKGNRDQDNMKSELRKEVLKLDLDKMSEKSGKGKTMSLKEHKMRKNLSQISNILPSSDVKQSLSHFDSVSEPLHEQTPNQINTQFLLHQTLLAKKSAFSRKDNTFQHFSQQNEMKQTISNKTPSQY